MNYADMNLAEGWKSVLKDEFKKEYFQKLWKFVEEEYKSTAYEVYPPKDQIFRALNLCSLEDVKVVIVGQDPYYTKGDANGLCFSLNPGVSYSKRVSLRNIFEKVRRNFPEKEMPENGDLTRWAEQGVLLLNCVLSVKEGRPNSHKNRGWEIFTRGVIEVINSRKSGGVVFMLWGRYAKRRSKLIDGKRHCVLKSAHPAARGKDWFETKDFEEANKALQKRGLTPIDW